MTLKKSSETPSEQRIGKLNASQLPAATAQTASRIP